ncbi:hypothetical protein B0T16DRAFT_455991 [Cercophora newfieldiana]|uniref:Uncharacterized protein n=1 Tax=Cercophora newfieldiana TaxID=92897 RepID=A0AA39YAS8_9PEZI|nr:hypothetical protein B0T16DRAFT_455991 [Cercophora newfieldiana]
MKTLIHLVAVIQLFLLPAVATYIYNGYLQQQTTVHTFTFIRIYNVTDPPPTCDDLVSAPEIFRVVSNIGDLDQYGGAYCEGKDCAWQTRDPSEIDTLSFNISGTRFTWSKETHKVRAPEPDWPLGLVMEQSPFARLGACLIMSWTARTLAAREDEFLGLRPSFAALPRCLSKRKFIDLVCAEWGGTRIFHHD